MTGRHWLVLLLLLAVGVGFYASSFGNEFVWDDRALIVGNEAIRDWSRVGELFSDDILQFGPDDTNFYRPLQGVSYALDYSLWKLDPRGYHLASSLYHILNAFLIYLILVSVLQRLDPAAGGRASGVALGVALIWLVSPIHAQAVTYAAGRADVLAAFFLLLSLLTFLRGRRVLSWLCFAASLLSKEYGAITPFFLLLFDRFGLVESREGRIRTWLPYLLILAAYGVLRANLFDAAPDPTGEGPPGLIQRLLTAPQSMLILMSLLVAPLDLSMERNIAWATSIFDWKVLGSCIVVLGLGWAAWWQRARRPWLAFGLCFLFVGFLPFVGVVPLNANVSEHWMYVPSIGVLLLLVSLLSKIVPGSGRALPAALLVVAVAALGIRLVLRNADFADEITLFEQILERNPDNARVHYNLGNAYFELQDMSGAREHYEAAIGQDPEYAQAYGNLANVERSAGNREAAIRLHERANELQPDLADNRASLGSIYFESGRPEEAFEQFRLALEIDPGHLGAMNGLAVSHAQLGDLDEAERLFRAILAAAPGHRDANANLRRLQELRRGDQPD